MTETPSSTKLLNAALSLAQDKHWEALRLYEIADYLDISLAQVHSLIPDKETLVDLLWDRADAEMLSACAGNAFQKQSAEQQLQSCIMAWLKPLHPHQKTVKEMLLVRLEPGHLHIQLPTLIRISQTVQWMRELSQRDNTFIKRALDESMLTFLFVSHLIMWLRDSTTDAIATERALQQHIRQAVALEKLFPIAR